MNEKRSNSILRPSTALAAMLVMTSISLPCVAYAPDRDDNTNGWIEMAWENDIFANEDAGYTNGIGVSWGHRNIDNFDSSLPDWSARLLDKTFLNKPQHAKAAGYFLGQTIYTPADISLDEPDATDRPYAGLLLWSGVFASYDETTSDRLRVTAGMVGPASFAEESQELIHRVTGSEDPQGWDHQLHNEPVFALSAERLLHLADGHIGNLDIDSSVGAGVTAGNLLSAATSLLAVRVGTHLDATWAALSTVPTRSVNKLAPQFEDSWQCYIAVSGSWVANDITLNGNTFRNSPSVDLIHEQAMLAAGVAFNHGHLGWSFSYQQGSDQFENQQQPTRFGSLSVTYLY